MSRAEAALCGLLLATIVGGSVLMYLAAIPYVFDEDLAWSVALTIGSIFALLGVLERPSRRRVIGCGALILAANLDRLTTGWACVVAAVLIAAWFRFGRGGEENKRWFWPVLAAGLVPLAAGCAVNLVKFGVPIGLPVTDQVYSSVNAYRRRFLAANGNSEIGLQFAPSNALAYMRPDGLRLTSVFPFITLPAGPAKALFGILFDRRYRTASMPNSMPLLFLLSCWGVVTAFRRRPLGKIGLTRVLLLASALAGAALLGWGYIADRYLADFMPFLILGSAVGLFDIWRRLENRRRVRRASIAAVSVLGIFSIAANVGIAIAPNEEWSTTQVLNYVQTQKSISDITGHPLNGHVVRGTALPNWAPADQLFVIGRCNGLYISTGEDYRTVPMQQFQHANWLAVERGPAFQHTLRLTFAKPVTGSARLVPLVSVGSSTLYVLTAPAGDQRVRVSFYLQDPRFSGGGIAEIQKVGATQQAVVITDPATHLVEVFLHGSAYLDRGLAGNGPILVHSSSPRAGTPAVWVLDATASSPRSNVCRSLTGN